MQPMLARQGQYPSIPKYRCLCDANEQERQDVSVYTMEMVNERRVHFNHHRTLTVLEQVSN